MKNSSHLNSLTGQSISVSKKSRLMLAENRQQARQRQQSMLMRSTQGIEAG